MFEPASYPLGINTMLVDVDMPPDILTKFNARSPSKFYVINFEKYRNYKTRTMVYGGDIHKYHDSWRVYHSEIVYSGKSYAGRFAALTNMLIRQVDWNLVILPMLYYSVYGYMYSYSCSGRIADMEGIYNAMVMYLVMTDQPALLELGAEEPTVLEFYNIVLTWENS